MRTALVALALCLTAALTVSAVQAAPSILVSVKAMKQGKLKGEAGSGPQSGRFPAVAFSHEIISPRDPATGQATGMRMHKPLVITKEWGAASPQLLEALVNNENLNEVFIEFVRTNPEGAVATYATIKLTNAQIASVSSRVSLSRPGEPPDNRILQDIAFTYQKIEFADIAGGTMMMDDWGAGEAHATSATTGTGAGTGTRTRKSVTVGPIIREQ